MPTQHINLSLPTSWNACTVPQLELIAQVMHEQIARADRYHPFSLDNVRLALFFALSGIEVLSGPNPLIPVEDQYYTCRLSQKRKWYHLISLPREGRGGAFFPREGKSGTFSLYLWQVHYWLQGSPLDAQGNLRPVKSGSAATPSRPAKSIFPAPTVLSWLSPDSGIFLTTFPYPSIRRRKDSSFFILHSSFKGPDPDLANFSWSQYRLATEAMQSYTQLSNSLLKMQALGTFSPSQLTTQTKNVDLARAMFLATIYIAKTKFVDTSTGIIKHDYHYQSNQITDNAQYFRNFPDTQWQVILFWWTGIMHSLSKRYPHVFKVQKVEKKPSQQSPLDIYSATIATMQKYVGLDENQCNNQSYSLVLEQLERMAKENEELERIRKKK